MTIIVGVTVSIIQSIRTADGDDLETIKLHQRHNTYTIGGGHFNIPKNISMIAHYKACD